MRDRPSPPWPALLSRVLLIGTVLLAGGCRASVSVDGVPPPPPGRVDAPPPPAGAQVPEPARALLAGQSLHWPVPAAAPMVMADPVLWVALGAHLGPARGGDAALATPLTLRGAGGLLTLIDGSGQRFMAPSLVLHWRRQPLSPPLRLRRRVIGPLASFESAEEMARRWRGMGVSAVIAHPSEWEVWGPVDSPAPEGVASRLVDQLETHRLGLELRRAAAVVPLQGPIRVEAPAGLHWRGGVYSGPFRLQSDAYGSWSLVEQVPLERYLEGVVSHEIGAGAPPAALAAQAVLARTWAIRNSHRFAVDGYHLCADTQCQVYSDPRQAGAAARQAIAASRHQVVAWQGEPIHAVYHASNGGMAAGFEEVWNGDPLPYLRAFADGPTDFQSRFAVPLAAASLPDLLADGRQAFGSDHSLFRWRRQLTAPEIVQALGPAGAGVGQLRGLTVLERGSSGRVLALQVEGSGGKLILRRDAIRRTLRRLPSTLFRVSAAGTGAWQVEGGGFGHGAGLSQAGAIDLARRGWTAQRILMYYYPGTELRPLRDLGTPLNIAPTLGKP